MIIYRLYSQVNDEQPVCDPTEYATFSEAEDALKKMIAVQGKKMNVASYISAIRKGKNGDYRKVVADALENIFSENEPFSFEKIERMLEAVEDFNTDCCLGEASPINDFRAVDEGGILVLDFGFDQRLHLEFDVYSDAPNGALLNSYFFLKDRNVKYKVNVEDDILEKVSNSANILYVYHRLLADAREVKRMIDEDHISPNRVLRGVTPEDMQKNACFFAGKQNHLSVETIVKHIHTLQQLGIPIKRYKISPAEKEFWEARHMPYNEGYEIDPDFGDRVPVPVDAGGWGAHVFPLLVLFIMKSAGRPMRQADIIEAMKKKYNVKIDRKTVARHMELLMAADTPIEKTKDGYVFDNGGSGK